MKHAEMTRTCAEIDALLAAHYRLGTVRPVQLDTAACARVSVVASSVVADDSANAVIGPYKLLERIGVGGMGEVWMAEQREPMQRKVALKIIKAGMDTRSVIARFEAERQALALMDHPNIAKVLDGGQLPLLAKEGLGEVASARRPWQVAAPTS